MIIFVLASILVFLVTMLKNGTPRMLSGFRPWTAFRFGLGACLVLDAQFIDCWQPHLVEDCHLANS
jgi:hypothetical protein